MEGVGSVLVIDDEPVLQDVLGTLLRGAGFDVHSATSAEEGLTRLRDEEIDVVDIRALVADLAPDLGEGGPAEPVAAAPL